MENNIKKSLHIELFGVPGSGKSTVSHRLADLVMKEGYNVREASFTIDHNNSRIVRMIKKILITIFFRFSKNEKYISIKKIVKKNGYSGISCYRQLVNIVPKIVEYDNKDNNIYIWDEGLIQSAISLSTFNEIDVNENITALTRIIDNNNMIAIHIIVDREMVKKRLKNRNSHDSRLEKQKETFNEVLNRINKICNSVHKEEIIDFLNNQEIINIDELYKTIKKNKKWRTL